MEIELRNYYFVGSEKLISRMKCGEFLLSQCIHATSHGQWLMISLPLEFSLQRHFCFLQVRIHTL